MENNQQFGFVSCGGLHSSVNQRSGVFGNALNKHPVCVRVGVRSRISLIQCGNNVTMNARVESAWIKFAEKMKETNEVPDVDEWNKLIQLASDENDFARGVWFIKTMKDTGVTPSPRTYEVLLESCIRTKNNQGAFHLVELMYDDKIPLGDMPLPEGMEATLRAILPPEAFN
uniref:Pentacotripeptide-repeat region of PRORP domain-containing protein n=1 Tax=Timspurckia oligopyrenoides TaxID=708627 RepID=A0A7S1ER26_9RHOD|mmetsp:Transcript_13798/g.24753  ORF Transcript_13798/g.24753 Transcript_13798/m.24753 type:complete len:172 (+) Transcript_13798:61-576(+)